MADPTIPDPMKAYYFNLQVENVDAALAKGKAQIEARNGTLTGNDVSGSFSIPAPFFSHIGGLYGVQGNVVTVTITNSPGFASPQLVANQSATFFGGKLQTGPTERS